jgi:hypothetical protein
MRSRRRWLALGVPAALAALVVGAALAGAAPAATARHANDTAAAAPHVNGLFHIVQRGFVKDCELIAIAPSSEGLYITGNGRNTPVTLHYSSSANCWSLYNKFTIKIYSPFNGDLVTATGYQYQNEHGSCLWQNTTSGQLETGVACNSSDTAEDFYGIPGSIAVGYGGWLVTSYVSEPPGSTPYYFWDVVNTDDCPYGGEGVSVAYLETGQCFAWNFPQG